MQESLRCILLHQQCRSNRADDKRYTLDSFPARLCSRERLPGARCHAIDATSCKSKHLKLKRILRTNKTVRAEAIYPNWLQRPFLTKNFIMLNAESSAFKMAFVAAAVFLPAMEDAADELDERLPALACP